MIHGIIRPHPNPAIRDAISAIKDEAIGSMAPMKSCNPIKENDQRCIRRMFDIIGGEEEQEHDAAEGEVITGEGEQNWSTGEQQPSECRDMPFAIAFYIQVAVILGIAVFLGVPAYEEASSASDSIYDDDSFLPEYSALIGLAVTSAAISWILSTVALFTMSFCAKLLVQISLIFSVVCSFLIAVMSLISGNIVGAVFGLIFFLFGLCYACIVWRRIPFAAANLNTALAAVKSNFGVTVVAFLLVGLTFIWCLLWLLSFIGIYNQTCDSDRRNCEDPNGILLFLFFVALYWTQQVIQNTIHVTVAGVVGQWWFDPVGATYCCSGAVCGSFIRATTTSFGSICFGSLLVAVIQALRQMAQQARRNNGNDLILCLAECILSCLQSIIEYFNKWAYIYVGLYGYDYITAGQNVMTLFNQRGWSVIIADDLVSNTLGLMSLSIGLLTGLIALIVEHNDELKAAAFLIAFIIGILITSIMMSVVDSAVNTVIVCFAEAPADFQTNHPTYSEEMLSAWRSVYPNDCGF